MEKEYRKCFVPSCKNDTVNSPAKIFVRIRESLREKWCREAGVEFYKIYKMFCCEDHFNPKEDLKNYYQHKLMNQEPQLKHTASFYCKKLDRSGDSTQLKHTASFCCKKLDRSGDSTQLSQLLVNVQKVGQLLLQQTPIQKKRKYDDFITPSTSSYSTLPLKIDAEAQCSVKMLDKSTNYKARKTTNVVTLHMQSSLETSSATATASVFGCISETEESTVSVVHNELNYRKKTLDIILNKPKMYLGLQKQFIWLIDYIVGKSCIKIDSLSIIITLFKIKQNDSIERLSDQFEISRTKLSSVILTGIEVLANFFQNSIFSPQPKQIKQNLPLVFKIQYSDVQMIIDCFEIEIVKPSNPAKQAQTWSQYKNCNTVKYLIGCTPDGFVSFISKGYGGRISDKALVEKSNLIHSLQPNAVVLADRGFKEIDSLLCSHGMKLLRPPSVYAGSKQTPSEAIQSKVIANLRVHIERVIRRVQEFALLKPHSVVNYKYVPYLDDIVIIVCGLINLQGEIIKTY